MTKRSDAVRYLLHNKRDAFCASLVAGVAVGVAIWPQKGGTTAAAKAKSKKAAATNVISGKHESATKNGGVGDQKKRKEKTKLSLV